jgi:hypothetical protein
MWLALQSFGGIAKDSINQTNRKTIVFWTIENKLVLDFNRLVD